MTSGAHNLAHLTGYSTLALVLGTAEWSAFGWVFALPLVIGTLVYAGWLGYRAILRRAKDDLPVPVPEQEPTSTDGGRRVDSETVAGGDRNRQDTNSHET